MEEAGDQISFELLGERFTVKSDVPKNYFLKLVKELDGKIQEIRSNFPTLSNVKAVILAALNYADELAQKNEKPMDNEALELITDLSESLASAIEEED
jgi:cell division protein ZapA (FtsZ GTPase activity inhibitor)